MNFAFSEEQDEFRAFLRRFLEESSPTTEVFRLMETPEGSDPAVWKQMAGELGLQGVHLPEAVGGQGFGFVELCIAMEEMGRVLLCSPYFSTVCLAANAILNAGSDEQRARLLPGIASGDTVGTLALVEGDGGWRADEIALPARGDGDGWRLTGEKRLVTDGATAELVIVAARRADTGDLGLFAARADSTGLRASPVESLDATRKLADLAFDDVPAELLGDGADGGEALGRTLDQAAVALAAESTGGAQRCLDSAVAYAKERVQFGQPIGAFQAIKHKCAEVLLEVESAKSTACWAGWTADAQPGELALAASVAKSFCDEAYTRSAAENLHIHGGMGFTWEADPHLYFKRAQANSALLGTPAFHRARIADLQGL